MTGLEKESLATILDYIDTLEAACAEAYDALGNNTEDMMVYLAARKTIREALDQAEKEQT